LNSIINCQNKNSMKPKNSIFLINLLLWHINHYGIIMTKISTKLINGSGYILFMSKESIRCPYCESLFNNNEELSKHIDRIHLGSGLLEGDSRKF
jgi:hypothetical protein